MGLPQSCVSELYRTLPIAKVRGLGGKLGDHIVEQLQITTMQQLAGLPTSSLASVTDPKTAAWLALLCQGQDGEDVKERELPKSIGCGKNFRGPEILDSERAQMMQEWLEEIQEEGGNPGDIRLAVGAAIVEEIRAEVFTKTSFRCSAGISHCKTLAKLCAGQNKPNGQTVLPQSCVSELYRTLPWRRTYRSR